ncbi:hypothetical protein Cfor_04202 [Coptotermes formosanus]|jgi:hypothetical protein|uniref:Uncharacterized protein n=1 Tax=Coptotermes formosanus TaxID=36987 RepID=A0A6L2PGU7_COPFO|nr:hypothetical protein Cfor_04202 [Coptotermes formosanus]
MWLEAFHLLMNVHHGYAIGRMFSVNYSGVTDSYLILMKDMGFRFLTVWNLVSEGLHIKVWNPVRASII